MCRSFLETEITSKVTVSLQFKDWIAENSFIALLQTEHGFRKL